MELVKNMERSICALKNEDYTAALNFATLAIDSTAKRFYGKPVTRTLYKKFIKEYYWLLEKFIGPIEVYSKRRYPNLSIKDEKGIRIGGDEGPEIADIIYHVFRCKIHHGEAIPINFSIVPSNEEAHFSVCGGENFMLPSTVIPALLAICLACRSNLGLGKDSACLLTFDTSSIVDYEITLCNSNVIRLKYFINKGEILRFPFKDFFGREDEMSTILANTPKQIKFTRKLNFPVGTYAIEYEKIYVS